MNDRRLLTRRLCGLMVVLLAIVCVGCRDRIEILMETVVYDDGSLEYVLTVRATNSDGEKPKSPEDWIEENAGVRMTDRANWDSLVVTSSRIRARAFFPPGAQPPSLLSYRDELGWHDDGITTAVRTEARGLLRSWFFEEIHPEPGGFERVDQALDTVLETTREILENASRKHFGEDLDVSGISGVLQDRVRPLMITLLRENAAMSRASNATRADGWRRVLDDQGVPLSTTEDPEDYLELQTELMLVWLRDQIAEVLSESNGTISGEDLTFFPTTGDMAESIERMAVDALGDWDETVERLEPAIAVLMAYLMGSDGAQIITDRRLRMPGTRIQTNGLPGLRETFWLIRDEDLDLSQRRLVAISARVETAALRSLGVQRELTEDELLRLYDVLWIRDAEGALGPLLKSAIRQGNGDLLLEDGETPTGMSDVAQD
ncbi:MAG: hypothetical protein OEV00_11720, partial [Acidobacteriota bacterium]|nr:hypothetical protein [Acidobacteriota bacterium]